MYGETNAEDRLLVSVCSHNHDDDDDDDG